MQPFEKLEYEWARFNDLDPAGMVACSSGTAALHLALEAFHWLDKGSEVIVPDFAMIACPRAVAMAGFVPVFVDCDEKLLIDEKKMCDYTNDPRNRDVAAWMVMHTYGRAFDFGDDWDPCEIWQIEDLAEAHGVRPHRETNAACWSFYRNKIVAGEEGGAVWFRDPKDAEYAKQLRSLGFTDAHDYRHVPRGMNYRLANKLAEPILDSLSNYKSNAQLRRLIEDEYEQNCPDEWLMPPRDAVWIYDVRIPGMTSDMQTRVVKSLRDMGVQARHGFKPMHTQEEFTGCRRVGGSNAEKASVEVIYLPVSTDMVAGMAADIMKLLKDEVSRERASK